MVTHAKDHVKSLFMQKPSDCLALLVAVVSSEFSLIPPTVMGVYPSWVVEYQAGRNHGPVMGPKLSTVN